MPYRSKNNSPFAEFYIRDRGPSEYPDLNIEVESTYNIDFVEQLKAKLRHGSERGWDPENKRWYISLSALDRAIAIAKVCFSNVYKTEGDEVVDLVTGEQIPQTGNLFQ